MNGERTPDRPWRHIRDVAGVVLLRAGCRATDGTTLTQRDLEAAHRAVADPACFDLPPEIRRIAWATLHAARNVPEPTGGDAA